MGYNLLRCQVKPAVAHPAQHETGCAMPSLTPLTGFGLGNIYTVHKVGRGIAQFEIVPTPTQY